jgi:hypothetical protein
MTTLGKKKKDPVTYPTKLSPADKKRKVLEFGTIKEKDEGKIIDDEADE